DKVMLTNEDPYDYPSRSILPQGYLGHDESIKGYPYDFEKAEKLLDDAGYTRDDSNSRFNLTISAFLIDEYQITQGTLGHIISSLSKLGINCELIIEDKEILQEKLENGEIDIFLLDTIHDTDSAFLYVYLHSEGIYNYCGFRNDIVDLLLELSIATPVIQEREYYYQQIQKICQEKVPYLLLVESGITYTRAKHVAPYVYFNGAYRFRFNCTKIFHNSKVILPNVEITKSNNNNLKTMTDIKVKENALYFPFTDAIVTNFNEQPITVTMRMSNELTRFLPDHEEKGKFYEVLTDEPNLPYRVRCYYDLPELDKDRSIDQLAIFEYDDRDETWIELTTKTSNSSLKYLEVELIGSYSLLRLGELAAEITYKFLPFVAIITVFMSGIISITIFYNQKIAKYVQKMEETL
ncbi:MAG: ABC transporter substrate-binding protein, partial [Candidatus Hodarchaeota archaeon]